MGLIESEAEAIAWVHQMAKTPTPGDHEVTDPHPYCLGDDPCCCVQLIAAEQTARADERAKAAGRAVAEMYRWDMAPSDPDAKSILAADYLHERQQRVVEAIFFSPGDCAKPFVLQRDADISGVSGEGIVADGVEFPDGCVALRWRGGHPTSVVFHDRGIESVEAIHGHGGNTRIVYVTEDIGERAAEVAEAEARGWNAAVEAAIKAVDDVYPVSDQWGHHTLPHIDRRQASAAIAALRKPEVDG